jgi:hypothetical protein
MSHPKQSGCTFASGTVQHETVLPVCIQSLQLFLGWVPETVRDEGRDHLSARQLIVGYVHEISFVVFNCASLLIKRSVGVKYDSKK